MTAWAFDPEYRFYLYQNPLPSNKDRTKWNRPRAFRLTSMMQIQASLVVAGRVGQMSAVFADVAGQLRRVVNPQPMNQVQLWLKSRCPGVGPQPEGAQFAGGWRIAWTGYVDTVEHTVDAQSGSMVTLLCSTPHKLWDTTSQEEGNALLQYASAAVVNVSGEMMLEFSALQCGYKPDMLRIDPNAHSGTGFAGDTLSQASWNPELQTWGAVIQAYLANAGLEFFFDEEGHGIWRRIGFIGQPTLARRMETDEMLTATLASSDQGLYTDIEVRPQFGGSVGFVPLAGVQDSALANLQAPGNLVGLWPSRRVEDPTFDLTETMRQHIGRRFFVAYAPWVTSNASPTANTQPGQNATTGADFTNNLGAADYLAKVLGLQAAAGALHGQVTLVADPQFRIGTIVYVPPLKQDPRPWIVDNRPSSEVDGSYYYVQSVTYNLTWGGGWFMTLGLAYGHSKDLDFPYIDHTTTNGQIAYPVLTAQQSAVLHTEDRNFLTDDTLHSFSFTLLPAKGGVTGLDVTSGKGGALKDDEIAVDPRIFVTDKGGKKEVKLTANGRVVGPTPNGWYKLRAAPPGSGLVIYGNVKDEVDGVTMTARGGQSVLQPPPSQTLDKDNGKGDVVRYWGSDPTDYTTGGVNLSGLSKFDVTGTTYTPGLQTSGLVPPTAPGIPGAALRAAYTRAGKPYTLLWAGPSAWDCSGLVAWAYWTLGIDALIHINGGGDHNTDLGPDLIYSYFKDKGAKDVAPQDARPGDLLVRFGHHIAFSIGNNHNFGADGPTGTTNIGESGNDWAGPFDKGLDMQSVDWSQVPGASQVQAQIATAGAPVSTTGFDGGIGAEPGPVCLQALNLALDQADKVGQSHYTQYSLQGQTPGVLNFVQEVDPQRDANGNPVGTGVLSPGQLGKDGHRQFDCAGLVAWCYYRCGFKWDGGVEENADGSINYGPRNAQWIYDFLSKRSDVTDISPSDAKAGDLIFGVRGGAIEHIGFCQSPGVQFGANNYDLGIRGQDMANYDPPFLKALNMQSFLAGTGTARGGTFQVSGDLVSAQQLVYIARTVGVPEGQLWIAVAIALAESGGPDSFVDHSSKSATNHNGPTPGCPNGSTDYGLWQINGCYHPEYDTTRLLSDPLYNGRAMYAISSQGTTWSPWSSFTSGIYTVHQVVAQDAVAKVPPGTVPTA